MTRTVSMLLFDGFSNLCLANAVEPLRAANTLSRRPLYDWTVRGLDSGTLASSSGLAVRPEPLTPLCSGAALFVMPSYGHAALATPDCLRRLRAAARRFDLLAGLDTGSWLLAEAGLLDGYRATAHWDILGTLSERFSRVHVTEDRYLIDRDRASCGGATTTLDLMLALIDRHHGAALALEVAALFMHGERDPRLDLTLRLPSDRVVQAAAALMRRHVEAPLPIGAIARRLGLDQRRLQRCFRAAAAPTPARVYGMIRLSEARRRIEQSCESLSEIAARTGYADATVLSRAFRAQYGHPPSALRKQAQDA